MPGDDTGQRDCVKIAEDGANTSGSVDGIAVREAFEVRSKGVFEVECHPVCLGRSAVDKEHDTECNSIKNREDDCKPDTPVPFPRVRACH